MHRGSVLGADADDDVAEDGLSAGSRADLDGDDVLVLEAVFLSGLGVEVDVSLRDDDALRDLYLTCGAYELAAGRACYVAGLSDGSHDAELARVGERYLDLVVRSFGAEDGHCHLTSGADYGDLLGAGELSGLGKVLLVGELIALSVEDIEGFSCHVQMMRGGFNHNFHNQLPPFIFYFALCADFILLRILLNFNRKELFYVYKLG